MIKPIRKLNTDLIVEEWENIQRIMVSLAVKETTQSIIVGKLSAYTELEQQLWSECGRLIANCILYYNASILSNVLAHRESSGDVQGVEVLKQISPVAWQHINLYGRYEFRKCSEPIDLDDIVSQLTQVHSY